MQKLLRQVEDQLYDGLVVMDIDCLGRKQGLDVDKRYIFELRNFIYHTRYCFRA